jgi:radical SAM superfamily enzyme YgiQ (UPF0313 family)
MKVLLINPDSRYERVAMGKPHIPYGLLYLAAALRQSGHQVSILDRNTSHRDEFDNLLQTFGPELVGLSVMTGPVIRDALEVSARIRQLSQSAKVVWNGGKTSGPRPWSAIA